MLVAISLVLVLLEAKVQSGLFAGLAAAERPSSTSFKCFHSERPLTFDLPAKRRSNDTQPQGSEAVGAHGVPCLQFSCSLRGRADLFFLTLQQD